MYYCCTGGVVEQDATSKKRLQYTRDREESERHHLHRQMVRDDRCVLNCL